MRAQKLVQVLQSLDWHLPKPRRLDARLAELNSGPQKDWVAKTAHWILRQPASFAAHLGIGMRPGEPWNLPVRDRLNWKGFEALAVAADRTGIDFQKLQIQPVAEDLPPWILSQIPSESWAIKLCEPAPVSVRMVGSENWNQIFNESRSQFPVPFQSSPLVPSCFRFERYLSVKALPPAIAKNAVIQDEGSQCLAAFALDPEAVHPEALRKSFTDPAGPEAFWTRPSWDFGPLKVVDACAGAGGKALAIADQMRAQGRIYAYDIAPKKIQALKLRARALDLHNIQAQVITPDAQEILGRFSKTADRVLVDAPCSGWGVLRRNPDLKWQDPDESAERLEKLQREILERMKELVRPGGILTFGVCTFRKQETLDVAQEFTARNPDFEWIRGGYLGPVPTDAFYMAAWRRKGQS